MTFLFSAYVIYLGQVASSLVPLAPQGCLQYLRAQQCGCHPGPSLLDPLFSAVTQP